MTVRKTARLPDRCLTLGLPEFGAATGSFRRIVQTPGGITMFYDVGQGQGWQRNIVMNGSPHLPASVRQWFGDSRGHWEGDTLVVDVTNFSPKTDYQGARENLHLVERWKRTGPDALELVVTIEDPTVWTRPWTVKQEFTRQSEQENRLYTEPRCIEGQLRPSRPDPRRSRGGARFCGRPRAASRDQGQRHRFRRGRRRSAAMTANGGRKQMRDRCVGLLMTVALAVMAVDAATSLAVAQAPQIVRPPARIEGKPNFSGHLAGQQRGQLGPAGPRRATRRSHPAGRLSL